jgi:hypothetical protein
MASSSPLEAILVLNRIIARVAVVFHYGAKKLIEASGIPDRSATNRSSPLN